MYVCCLSVTMWIIPRRWKICCNVTHPRRSIWHKRLECLRNQLHLLAERLNLLVMCHHYQVHGHTRLLAVSSTWDQHVPFIVSAALDFVQCGSWRVQSVLIIVVLPTCVTHTAKVRRCVAWLTRWHYSAFVTLILFALRTFTPLYFSQVTNNTTNTFYLILACHRMCEAVQELPK